MSWSIWKSCHVKKETKIQQTPDRTIEMDSSADLSAVHQNLLIEGGLLKEEKQRGKPQVCQNTQDLNWKSVATGLLERWVQIWNL